MTEEDLEEIVLLGKLRALHESMNSVTPTDENLRASYMEAKRMIWMVLDAHWDKCNKMITEYDQ